MPHCAAVALFLSNYYKAIMGKTISLRVSDGRSGAALSRLMNSATVHEAVVNTIDAAPSMVRADGVAVFLFENGGMDIVPRGIPDAAISHYLSLPVGSDPLLIRMGETRQPVHEGHIFCAQEWRKHDFYLELISRFGFEHYLITPLVDNVRVIGALAFARREASGSFVDHEMAAVAMTTAYASVAVACCQRAEIGLASCIASLTGREPAISRLVAKGLSNGEIAEQLQLSENTVKKYLKAIFAKLGVSRRAELAWLATLAGVV